MASKKGKGSEWRKGKREHGGSIYEYQGRLYARVQFTGEDGKRREKKVAVKSRSEARTVFKQLREKLNAHGEKAVSAHDMTFKKLVDVYRELKLVRAVIVNGRKVGGLRSYRSARGFLLPLVKHFGRRKLRTIKHSHLEAYQLDRLREPLLVCCGKDAEGKPEYREREGQRAISSVNREMELARAMFRYAQREGWIVKSPFEAGTGLISKEAEVSRERVLTHEEEARLLAACTGRRAHLKTLLICAVDTGMRRGELFKLAWPDIDLTANLIRVRATNTKTEKPRTVGMTPRLRQVLLELKLAAPPNYDGLVFGITSTIKNGFRSALKKAGIEGIRFHDLRHTCITRRVASGQPTAEVMAESGHTQYSTFKKYVNVSEGSVRKNAELLAAYNESQNVSTSESEAVN